MLSRLVKVAALSAALFGVLTPQVAGWCSVNKWSWSNGYPVDWTLTSALLPFEKASLNWYSSYSTGTSTGTNPPPACTSPTTCGASMGTIHGQTFPGVQVSNVCSDCSTGMWLTWQSEILDGTENFKVIVNDYYLNKAGQWTYLGHSLTNGNMTAQFTPGTYTQSDVNFQKFFKSNPTFPTDIAVITAVNSSNLCPVGYICNDPLSTRPILTTLNHSTYTATPSGSSTPKLYEEPVWAIKIPSFNCADTGVNYALIFDSHSDCSNQPGFTIIKNSCPVTPPPAVRGDPQFAGLRGQDFQVHGIDGGVYNVISDKHMQLNSKFVFLTGPRPCPVMPTTGKKSVACFAHSGSYLQNLALLTSGDDRLLIESGSAEDGLSAVTLNGEALQVGQTASLTFASGRTGYVSYNSTHEVTLRAGLFEMEVENSDAFLNLRAVRVSAADWSELKEEKAHGLLGQTWKVRVGKSAIEGKVDDYLLESEEMFGTDFMYNRFAVSA